MKNEHSRHLKRIYKWRNYVPKLEDSLTMKKTPQQTKNIRKRESNTLNYLMHNRRREEPWTDELKRLVYACRVKAPESLSHIRQTHALGLKAPRDLQKKLLFMTFSPIETHDFNPSLVETFRINTIIPYSQFVIQYWRSSRGRLF